MARRHSFLTSNKGSRCPHLERNDYWLRLVRKWLRNGGRYRKMTDNASSGYSRYFIDREGNLIRETVEVVDPETFAREHMSADVISLHRD
jgi:hypothetical protein